ncbi:MAG: GxxExxY protein [Verrucomicrobiaceae bacterium]|nr:GxxExxY protein [Verrucomicrobiaceae bacterium]MDB6119419.1 GxxExxY protein [Verrucomicrobiaceae bacterium]
MPDFPETSDNFPHKDLCYEVVGCAFGVLGALGHGFHEKPYENAMAVEFREKGWNFRQQPVYPLYHHGTLVGEYVPDFVVEDAIIVDVRVVETIGTGDVGQMLNYLKVTNLSLGLLFNFQHSQLEWRRVIPSDVRNRKVSTTHSTI